MSVRLYRTSLSALVLGCFIPVLAQMTQMPLGQHNDEAARPAEVRSMVSQYCRLDYEGARLDPHDSRLLAIVWWKTNPEYNQIQVISRYTVDTTPFLDHGKYRVTVHYRLLGTYDLVAGYVPEPPNTVQEVNFTVSSVNGEWRIADSDNTAPHPSRAAMLKWLSAKIAAAQDANQKALFESAQKQLQAQSGSPFAQ